MKRLFLTLLAAAALNAQQPPTRFVFGAPNSFSTPGDHVWSNALPCPTGATFYTVQFPTGGKFADFQQYNTLCYSIQPMRIDFITNPGLYIIRLYFIEQNAAVKPGGRTFNISINGDVVAKDYDILKHCSLYSGCNQSFVTVDQMGKISVVLNVTKYNAVISAIEVIRLVEFGDVFGEAEPIVAQLLNCHGSTPTSSCEGLSWAKLKWPNKEKNFVLVPDNGIIIDTRWTKE